MKILVLGATGGTGKETVEAALAAGHEVTALARRPEAIAARHDRLRVQQGDVLDAGSVSAAMRGQDAVLSAFGPSAGARPGTLISVGIGNVVRAMAAEGTKRLVFESGLMVGDARGMNVFKRGMVALFRAMNRELYIDKVKAEQTVRESGLEWIILRPPALKHLPARGAVRVGPDLDVNLFAGLAHKDVAQVMVACLAGAAHVGQAVDLSY
jgi:uncharacterized protein YbjT (DUF2867 family)